MPRRKIETPLRGEWLRRCEEGHSPSRIARDDGYDIRTVRKHLQLAEEERNRREATAALIRTALERHQADLLGVVQAIRKIMPLYPETGPLGVDLDIQLSEASPLKYKLLEALRKEHLPRADLWKAIRKWEGLRDSYRDAERGNDREKAQALLDQLLQQGYIVHDELDTLILRGVIPGRCRYCPV